MTVIACRILDKGFEISSDSITMRYGTQFKGDNVFISKLYEINGMVIGVAGYADDCGLMRLFAETRNPSSSNEYAFLEFMSDFSDWKKKKTDDSKIKSTFLNWLFRKTFLYKRMGNC